MEFIDSSCSLMCGNKKERKVYFIMMTTGMWQAWLIPLVIVMSAIIHHFYIKDELAPQNINNGWYIVTLLMTWYFLQCVVIIAVDGFVLLRCFFTRG